MFFSQTVENADAPVCVLRVENADAVFWKQKALTASAFLGPETQTSTEMVTSAFSVPKTRTPPIRHSGVCVFGDGNADVTHAGDVCVSSIRKRRR